MFIFDHIAFAPFNGFMFIVKEVAKAAEQEMEQSRNALMQELSGLHAQLEAGEISEDEFDEHEQIILDTLEAMGG
jgi:uncharacterized membrane protein